MNFLIPKNKKCCATCSSRLDCPVANYEYKKIYGSKKYKKMYDEMKENDSCSEWVVLYDEETT